MDSFLSISIQAASFLAIMLGLYFTRRHFKVVRSISYFERMNSLEFLTSRAKLRKWYDDPSTDTEEKISILEKNYDLNASVTIVYNILTEMSIAYKSGMVDKKIVRNTFDPLIPNVYRRLGPFFLKARREGNNLGVNLGHLNDDIMRRRKGEYLPVPTQSQSPVNVLD